MYRSSFSVKLRYHENVRRADARSTLTAIVRPTRKCENDARRKKQTNDISNCISPMLFSSVLPHDYRIYHHRGRAAQTVGSLSRQSGTGCLTLGIATSDRAGAYPYQRSDGQAEPQNQTRR